MMNNESELRKSYFEHVAAAQIYRWYAFYERPEATLANQLDLLGEQLKITSPEGEIDGRDVYAAYMEKLERPRRDAHEIKSLKLVSREGTQIKVAVELKYINTGLVKEGSVKTLDLAYQFTFEDRVTLEGREGVLPAITAIDITVVDQGRTSDFADTYATTRLTGLVNYWLALIESPNLSAEPFKELLAPSFNLNFSSGVIADFDAFTQWVEGPASAIEVSSHKIQNFSCEQLAENRYTLTVEFDWQGLLANGKTMTAITRHTWGMVDDPTERFARIHTIDVDVLETFKEN